MPYFSRRAPLLGLLLASLAAQAAPKQDQDLSLIHI